MVEAEDQVIKLFLVTLMVAAVELIREAQKPVLCFAAAFLSAVFTFSSISRISFCWVDWRCTITNLLSPLTSKIWILPYKRTTTAMIMIS